VIPTLPPKCGLGISWKHSKRVNFPSTIIPSGGRTSPSLSSMCFTIWFPSATVFILVRHLDDGYMFGWGSYIPGDDAPSERPRALERMHASLQCYPSTFLRPHHWREMVPGTCVAIHVRSGLLILRLFFPPNSEDINDRHDYFTQSEETERTQSTCSVMEVMCGELVYVFILFSLFKPYADGMRLQHSSPRHYFRYLCAYPDNDHYDLFSQLFMFTPYRNGQVSDEIQEGLQPESHRGQPDALSYDGQNAGRLVSYIQGLRVFDTSETVACSKPLQIWRSSRSWGFVVWWLIPVFTTMSILFRNLMAFKRLSLHCWNWARKVCRLRVALLLSNQKFRL
jgi:hypothetical protein